ncbi:MAG: HupE/UreJ family protein [Pyrinomonadaceae bacterium]
MREKALGIIALLFVLCGVALGHDVQASWTTFRFNSGSGELTVRLHAEAVRTLIQDTAPGATFEPENFDNVRPALNSFANTLYEVSAGGRVLSPTNTDVTVVEDMLVFRLAYTLPAEGPVRLRATHLAKVSPEFIAHLSVTDREGKPTASHVLRQSQPLVEIETPSGSAESGRGAFLPFLRLGVEHILLGYDHLLFLLGLLVACRRFSTMALVITCFTLAHSVTLALAALDLVTLSPRVVEPLIAASIVFVGIENLLRRDEPRWRWALTLAFGLIHGFGFASVLKEAGLGSSASGLLVPLFSFNLGVELGQVAVAAVVLPLLWRLRRWRPYERHGQFYISLLVVLAGSYWLLQRLFF